MKKFYKIITPALAQLFVLAFNVSAEVISSSSLLSIGFKAIPAQEMQTVSGAYTVSNSGFISMPLLDEPIKASGLTGTQLSRKIEAAYKTAEIYTNPSVNIITSKIKAGENIDAKIVSVGGSVKAPGAKPYARDMTLFQAVNAAGGANAYGADNRVELMRGGERAVYNMNNTADMEVKVYPNDTINVPKKNMWGK